jgi:hypothetical protein
MSIVEDVKQLKLLDIEIKRQQTELRKLRNQKKNCEKRIMDYLETTEQPGLRFQGMTIIAKESNKRRYRKKKDKEEAGEMILRRHGIYNSKEALDELLQAMRGSPERESKLHII